MGIKDLSNKRHLFKIDMNAQQFHLTGCCITCPGVANIVVIEGGPRAVKRYRKLMMRRIKWTEDHKDDDDGADSDDSEGVTAPKLQDHCVLFWEGMVVEMKNHPWFTSDFESFGHLLEEEEERVLFKLGQSDSE